MAVLAFLPWERWLARLLRPLYIGVRRWFYRKQRTRYLIESENWPQGEGTVEAVHADGFLRRDQIFYAYSTDETDHLGAHWRWFEPGNAHELRFGDKVRLRYDPANPDRSVVLGTIDHIWK